MRGLVATLNFASVFAAMLGAAAGIATAAPGSIGELEPALRQIETAEQVLYICRRGAQGRECYYVADPNRAPRERSYSNGVSPYYQPRPYQGPGRSDYHHWGGPDGPD